MDIVAEAKNGSQRAFTELYNKHYRVIYYSICGMVRNPDLAEDLTSEAFTKAFMAIDKFDKNISFELWLRTIANRHTIDFIRSANRRKGIEAVDDGDIESFVYTDNSNPEKDMINSEENKIRKDRLNGIGGNAKKVLVMRYRDGLKYQEIADKIGVSIGTVKSYISKYKQKVLNDQKQTKIIKTNKSKKNEKKSIRIDGNKIVS